MFEAIKAIIAFATCLLNLLWLFMCSKIILLKCQDVTHINHFLIIVIKTKFGASWHMIFPAKQKLQKCIFGLVSLFFKKASFTAYFLYYV